MCSFIAMVIAAKDVTTSSIITVATYFLITPILFQSVNKPTGSSQLAICTTQEKIYEFTKHLVFDL